MVEPGCIPWLFFNQNHGIHGTHGRNVNTMWQHLAAGAFQLRGKSKPIVNHKIPLLGCCFNIGCLMYNGVQMGAS